MPNVAVGDLWEEHQVCVEANDQLLIVEEVESDEGADQMAV